MLKSQLMMNVLIIFFIFTFTSCGSAIDIDIFGKNGKQSDNLGDLDNSIQDNAPSTSALIPTNAYRSFETLITLTYSDEESDQASSCSVSNLSNLTITTACNCDSGECTVGVKALGGDSYVGPASFDYSVTANSLVSNTSSVSFTINPIGSNNTEEWTRVPANAGNLGLSEFYVMKYEAKAWNDGNINSIIDGGEVDLDGDSVATGLNIPISIEDNQPWRNITANEAAAECESLGANYHLISNIEWMAMARDIENVATNWNSGIIGTGCIFRGNSGEPSVSGDGSASNNAILASLGCGYDSAIDPDSGSGRDSKAILTLSNGETVYDMAGNLAEWTDWDENSVGFQLGPTTCGGPGQNELPDVSCVDLLDSEYNTENGTYNSDNGVGRIELGFISPDGATFRGGYFSSNVTSFSGGLWYRKIPTGIFDMNLDSLDATTANPVVGFRCVYRP